MDKEDRKQQLNELIIYFTKGNRAAFARLLGVSVQLLSQWLSRGSFDMELIYLKCKNISSVWLLTGKGRMLQLVPDIAPPQPEPVSIQETLLSLIREKDAKIGEQAKQIGRLEQRVETLTENKD